MDARTTPDRKSVAAARIAIAGEVDGDRDTPGAAFRAPQTRRQHAQGKIAAARPQQGVDVELVEVVALGNRLQACSVAPYAASLSRAPWFQASPMLLIPDGNGLGTNALAASRTDSQVVLRLIKETGITPRQARDLVLFLGQVNWASLMREARLLREASNSGLQKGFFQP